MCETYRFLGEKSHAGLSEAGKFFNIKEIMSAESKDEFKNLIMEKIK